MCVVGRNDSCMAQCYGAEEHVYLFWPVAHGFRVCAVPGLPIAAGAAPMLTSWATVENTDWSGISTDVDLLEELCGFVLERRWILDGRFYLRGCLEFCVEHPASDFREFPCNANLVVQVNTAGSAEMFMLAFANHLHSLPLCRGRNKIPGVSGLDQMD